MQPGATVHICNPSTGDVVTGGPLELINQLTKLTGELQVQADTLSPKMEKSMKIPSVDLYSPPPIQVCIPHIKHSHMHTCTCTHTNTSQNMGNIKWMLEF